MLTSIDTYVNRYGICVDEDGDILVSEAEHGQILIFKADGNAFSGPYVVADEGRTGFFCPGVIEMC